ncbi:MAG: hypothetical protein IKL80_04730 [Clostridia bacterium]|nr:hypothetical protein [Clostridia bacterium]
MKRTKLKQGTLDWERARETRIGSSEVFDIVKYYATDEELQYCGFNAEAFRAEKPYTTVWALYHKMLQDGFYKKEALPPEFAEYGHAVEPYGVRELQKGRAKKLKPGPVYANERLIASLDIEGVAEEADMIPFTYGMGTPNIGQRFVCEQKTMLPSVIKNGLPFKYIIQAQYQIMQTKADFFILQLMVLKDDTVFNRGRICQMPRKVRYEYLDGNLKVAHYYFKNNTHLEKLIEKCLDLFFRDVDNRKEPTPFIEYDNAKNIIESIRLNALYNDKLTLSYDLAAYKSAKDEEELAISRRKAILQSIVELAKENNACRFRSEDGTTAAFAKDGSFRMRLPAEGVAVCN